VPWLTQTVAAVIEGPAPPRDGVAMKKTSNAMKKTSKLKSLNAAEMQQVVAGSEIVHWTPQATGQEKNH
jgi:hypothetical protein